MTVVACWLIEYCCLNTSGSCVPSSRRGVRIEYVCVVCARVDVCVCAHGGMIVVCCWLLIALTPVLVLTCGWCVVVCVHDDSSWLQVSPQLHPNGCCLNVVVCLKAVGLRKFVACAPVIVQVRPPLRPELQAGYSDVCATVVFLCVRTQLCCCCCCCRRHRRQCRCCWNLFRVVCVWALGCAC